MRSLEFYVSGLVGTKFLVEDAGDGTLVLHISVDQAGGDKGDLRAIFFDMLSDEL